MTFSKIKFEGLIKREVKIHSIRSDEKNRWKVGMLIHMWQGNPRNVSKHPYHFETKKVSSIQKIEINNNSIRIDGRLLDVSEVYELAKYDGFDNPADFLEFFPAEFNGKIIHWTNKRY